MLDQDQVQCVRRGMGGGGGSAGGGGVGIGRTRWGGWGTNNINVYKWAKQQAHLYTPNENIRRCFR